MGETVLAPKHLVICPNITCKTKIHEKSARINREFINLMKLIVVWFYYRFRWVCRR